MVEISDRQKMFFLFDHIIDQDGPLFTFTLLPLHSAICSDINAPGIPPLQLFISEPGIV